MAPAGLLDVRPGMKVLDLCAAPGGKTTQLAAALRGEGLLVCNEPVPSRAKILSRNIERMGVTNALVVSADPDQLCQRWQHCFDAILVDAPCSGEGMFRRHPETRLEWDEQSPLGCAQRQTRILNAAVQMLRPGGRLVYSTCTLNLEENDQVVATLLEQHPELEAVPFQLPIGGSVMDAPQGTLHLYPHQFKGEGHFVAMVRKAQDAPAGNATEFFPAGQMLAAPQKPMLAAYAAFGKTFGKNLPEGNAQFGDMLISAPDLPPLKGLKVLRAGLQLGNLKGKIFMPDHALAMSLPADGSYPTASVDEQQAAAYQRGETLPAPAGLSGFCLVALDGLALGFGKASDEQVKNHYPKGLRRG